MGNRKKWSEMSAACRLNIVLRILISILVVTMATLQLVGIWDRAINYAVPLLGVVVCLQSLMEWNTHRVAAIVGFVCAAFVWICTFVVWFG